MARRVRKARKKFSGEDARRALAMLIEEGKLAAGEIRRALERRERLIRALRARLAELGSEVRVSTRGFARRAAPVLERVARTAAPILRRVTRAKKRPGRARRRRSVSAAPRKAAGGRQRKPAAASRPRPKPRRKVKPAPGKPIETAPASPANP
jgi:hypothetical protein